MRSVLTAAAFFALTFSPVSNAQEQAMGFGAATTGGGSGPDCIVKNLNDSGPGSLRECVSISGPVNVKFGLSGTITLLKPLQPLANKTISGKGRGILLTGKKMTLIDVRKSNIIISDLRFEVQQDPGDICANPITAQDTKYCGLGIGIRGNVDKVWIHHNSFRHCGEKCIVSGYDFYGYVPDQISISHNLFMDSFFAILMEAIPDKADVKMRVSHVSFYNNHFRNIFRRSPRIAGYVQGHAWNNYIQLWGKENITVCDRDDFAFPSSSVGEAQLYLEKNVYRPSLNSACVNAVQTAAFTENGMNLARGYVKSSDNLLLKGAIMNEESPEKVALPPYKYSALSTSDVSLYVREQVGPRK